MSDYRAPSEVEEWNRSLSAKMNEKFEQEQKAERYDELMAANAKGQIVQMTASEFARMIRQIQLLDSIPREELRRAKERVKRERKALHK